MQKYEVLEKLNEFRNCKDIEITMFDGSKFYIPVKNIANYQDTEMIDSVENNFRCFYCSILSINSFS